MSLLAGVITKLFYHQRLIYASSLKGIIILLVTFLISMFVCMLVALVVSQGSYMNSARYLVVVIMFVWTMH